MVSSTTRHGHVLIIGHLLSMTFSGSTSEKDIPCAQETCTLDVSLPRQPFYGLSIAQGVAFEGSMLEEIASGSEEDSTKSAYKQIDR